jgi:DNA-binding protein Fis
VADGKKGIYMGIGLAPGYTFFAESSFPVNLSAPMTFGFSLKDYYTVNGVNQTFGFFSGGPLITLPLKFIASTLGNWSLKAGVQFPGAQQQPQGSQHERRLCADRVGRPLGALTRLITNAIPPLIDQLATSRPGRVYRDALALLERPLLAHVLAVTGGNQLRAARLLGLNRNTLRKRCRELELPLPRAARRAVAAPSP